MTKVSLALKSLAILIGWRILLMIAAQLAPELIQFQPSYPYWEGLIATDLPRQIYVWAGFDGVHYLKIAESGYIGTGLIQAFFPIYPYLIRFGVFVTNLQPIIVGLIISHLSLWGALFFSYLIISKMFSHKTAVHFWMVLLFFPTSFYFGAVYNESLYLCLLLASVWMGMTQKKTILGIWGGLSSGVRLVGLAWLVSWIGNLVWVELKKNNFRHKNIKGQKIFLTQWREWIGWSLGLMPLLIFLIFLWQEFGDPLYFYSVQSAFGASRQTRLILLPQTFYRSIKILITVRPFDWKYFSYIQDFLLSSVMLAGLVAAWKKISIHWWLFSLLAYLLPTLTGNLSSMPRYLVVIWPIMIWWARQIEKKPYWAAVYYLTSATLLIVNTMLFVQGHWVA